MQEAVSLHALPVEILSFIFSYLPNDQIVALSHTCASFRQILASDERWKELYLDVSAIATVLNQASSDNIDFQAMYFQLRRAKYQHSRIPLKQRRMDMMFIVFQSWLTVYFVLSLLIGIMVYIIIGPLFLDNYLSRKYHKFMLIPFSFLFIIPYCISMCLFIVGKYWSGGRWRRATSTVSSITSEKRQVYSRRLFLFMNAVGAVSVAGLIAYLKVLLDPKSMLRWQIAFIPFYVFAGAQIVSPPLILVIMKVSSFMNYVDLIPGYTWHIYLFVQVFLIAQQLDKRKMLWKSCFIPAFLFTFLSLVVMLGFSAAYIICSWRRRVMQHFEIYSHQDSGTIDKLRKGLKISFALTLVLTPIAIFLLLLSLRLDQTSTYSFILAFLPLYILAAVFVTVFVFIAVIGGFCGSSKRHIQNGANSKVIVESNSNFKLWPE